MNILNKADLMPNCYSSRVASQRGVALLVSLMLLLVITLLGLAIARTQFAGERMAQNELDHAMAVQAAEAALREAENNISQGQFTNFANANGLYTFTSTTPSWYLGIKWASPVANSVLTYGTTSYGSGSTASTKIAGPALSAFNLAAQPVYIVEQLPSVVTSGQSLNANNIQATPVYRITAYAVGGDSNTSALLQSIYR